MAQPPVIELHKGYRCGAHGKLAYLTKEEAEDALTHMDKYPGRKLPKRSYRPADDGDNRCIYWHLTSRPRR